MSLQQWHAFLESASTQHPVNDISVSVINETIICDLSYLGLLEVKGTDAVTFLQGQLTNDVKQLGQTNAHYSGYCTPKGRLLAVFLALSHQGHIHLQMPDKLVESITKRLKMFIMRSKVEIADASESVIKIGISGLNAPALLATQFTQVPQHDYELVSQESGTLLKLPGTHPRFEIFTDITHAPDIWTALSKQAQPTKTDVWEWLEIQAGIPDVVAGTQEEFVPQMLNMDLIGGINFKKGCYTGQEIVARTHYLGTIKRRTHLAHITTATRPNPGDNIINKAGDTIGKIVRCAPAPEGGYDLLAEIRLESIENEQVYINQTALEIKPLPYPLQNA